MKDAGVHNLSLSSHHRWFFWWFVTIDVSQIASRRHCKILSSTSQSSSLSGDNLCNSLTHPPWLRNKKWARQEIEPENSFPTRNRLMGKVFYISPTSKKSENAIKRKIFSWRLKFKLDQPSWRERGRGRKFAIGEYLNRTRQRVASSTTIRSTWFDSTQRWEAE